MPARTSKIKILRFKKFNSILGKMETNKNGGMILKITEINSQYQVEMVICPKDRVFSKTVAMRHLTTTTDRFIVEDISDLMALSSVDCESFRKYKQMCQDIQSAESLAQQEFKSMNDKIKFSGSSVYEYSN
jgi:hypothetical protein